MSEQGPTDIAPARAGASAAAAPPARARSFDFEQLEPSAPPPGNAPARVLAEAAAEADALRDRARAEGFEAGRAAGHEAGLAEVAAAARALQDALDALHAVRDELAEALERDAIELGIALAEKILAGALELRPELIVESVHGALRRLGDRRRVSVLVNPADLDLVLAALEAARASGGGDERVELQPEERVSRGATIVRTEEGEVDASVQTQLERAREAVATELQGVASP